jgi:hypothetical protein
MINHGRSLLLNIDGADYQPQYLGDEYIEPTFVRLRLPSYIQTARRIMFGSRPERVFLNYRVRELLHTIHETELAEYLYALDSRVTYWPEPTPVFFNQRKYVRSEQISGPFGARLFFSGNFGADNSLGFAQREYTVRAVKESNNYIVIEHDDKTFDTAKTQVNVASGLSSAVAVAGTKLQVRIGGAALTAGDLVLEDGYKLLTEALDMFSIDNVIEENTGGESSVFDGSVWRVTAFAPPASIVSLLPILEVMGEPNLLELFGASNYDQPYATFKNLWFDHPLAAYRLAGFTMAMIYRTEEIRRGQNG